MTTSKAAQGLVEVVDEQRLDPFEPITPEVVDALMKEYCDQYKKDHDERHKATLKKLKTITK